MALMDSGTLMQDDPHSEIKSKEEVEQAAYEGSDEPDPFFEDLLSDEDTERAAEKLFSISLPILDKITADGPQCSLADWKTRLLSQPVSDQDAGRSKTRSLLLILHQALSLQWSKGRSDAHMLELTQTLALLSRNQIWAVGFAEQGVLGFYVDVFQFAGTDSYEWMDAAMKLIANCCTRSLRTKQAIFPRAPLKRLVDRLAFKEEAVMATMALSAICSGLNEAIRELESRYHLASQLFDGLDKNFYGPEQLEYLFGLIQDGVPYVDPQSFSTRQLLAVLESTSRYDLSTQDQLVVGDLLCRLLSDNITSAVLIRRRFRQLMRFFLSTYNEEMAGALMHDLPWRPELLASGARPEEASLVELRKRLIPSLCKIANLVEDPNTIRHKLPLLVKWLEVREPQIQICACMVLGNLAFSHASLGRSLVQDYELGEAIIHCIGRTASRDVQTSAMDLLQNVGNLHNRTALGRAGVLDALSQGWESPNIFSARALYHTRQLLSGCPPNVLLFLRRESKGDNGATSLLDKLLFAYDQTQESTLIAEIGQVVAEVWRTSYRAGVVEGRRIDGESGRSMQAGGAHLETSGFPTEELAGETAGPGQKCTNQQVVNASLENGQIQEECAQLLQKVFLEPNPGAVTVPAMALVKSGNEALIAQGWFTLSLMAMSKEGAEAVYEQCITDDGNFEFLCRTLQTLDAKSGARNNARYLVAMLRRQIVDMAVDYRARLHSLPLQDALRTS